jgi:ABC-type transport system involved in cytochrome c biogenesis permease subunit
MRLRYVSLFVALVGVYLAYALVAVSGSAGSVERLFGELPVLSGGRVKPLDSLARGGLLGLSGKQTVRLNAQRVTATGWLMDMVFRPSVADAYPVFEIDDPDVLGLIGIQQSTKRRYSFMDLQPHLGEIQNQAARAEGVRPEHRSRYQGAILRLWGKVYLYWRLQNSLQLADPDASLPGITTQTQEIAAYTTALADRDDAQKTKESDISKVIGAFHQRYHTLAERAEFMSLPVSPESTITWLTYGQALLDWTERPSIQPGVMAWARMGDAYRAEDEGTFLEAVLDYRGWLGENAPRALAHAHRERIFNQYDPFYKSLVLYVVVCLLMFGSFLRWPVGFRQAGSGILVLAFVLHTGGLLARMILQGRPPVTNLYSSAIFVGWGAVFLGIILERMFKNGLGALGAAAIGFLTQIIALHLSAQGDTLEMMRAVLDSNFWLATHVVTITVGYSSTFLSGTLAIGFIVRGLFTKNLSEESAQNLTRMVYGIVCFTTFFSFIGTVLGGIWADQSWGRFWGWDPKENGALMIVLWNALILHAWWGKLVARRGLMVMAVFGNVITALSWFGVNMLGIGLHSYGFMDKAFPWIVVFSLSQFVFMVFGSLPVRFWSSPDAVSRD